MTLEMVVSNILHDTILKSNMVTIKRPVINYYVICKWCREQLSGGWTYAFNSLPNLQTWAFSESSDAILFKLAWG
jgi:hypothetical protein